MEIFLGQERQRNNLKTSRISNVVHIEIRVMTEPLNWDFQNIYFNFIKQVSKPQKKITKHINKNNEDTSIVLNKFTSRFSFITVILFMYVETKMGSGKTQKKLIVAPKCRRGIDCMSSVKWQYLFKGPLQIRHLKTGNTWARYLLL